jgi:Amt family ammonium transporter
MLVGKTDFPQSSLVYFQFVFAGITPILMLGSVLGRVNFKAWIPFVLLWSTFIYTVNAFLIWGGGWFAQHGAVDFSGGYVIHLAAGVSGFVAAWVIGPRLARDREVDAPNNLAMVALGAGLLWLGWNGFNGGDPYNAGADAAAAILNTNLATAVAFLVWVGWDYATGRKPSLLGSVNGMIVGLVAITPAAGFVNGYGAIMIGVIASTIVYFAYHYLSRCRPFRNVDDTLGVVYTHGFAGLAGGLLVGIFADSKMAVYVNNDKTFSPSFYGTGSLHLLKMQAYTGLWVICFTAVITFVLLKLVGLLVPLRMSDADMEEGDLAVHGHEVYPSDVPSLGYPGGIPGWVPAPAAPAAPTTSQPMATTVIVSYDGTDNDRDALARFARVFARAGAALELAYVRHSKSDATEAPGQDDGLPTHARRCKRPRRPRACGSLRKSSMRRWSFSAPSTSRQRGPSTRRPLHGG